MHVNKWDKFRLLMWKNWIIQWHRKKELIIQILAPVFFTSLLVLIRVLVDPSPAQPDEVYDPVPIDEITILSHSANTFSKQLAYSPENPFLEKIINGAAEKFKISAVALSNAAALEDYMTKNKIFAGVTFNDSWLDLTNYPKQLSFALRFPSELRTGEGYTWETNNLFPPIKFGRARNGYLADGGIPPGYIQEGFIALQHAISSSFVECVSEQKDGKVPYVMMHRYPYPGGDEDLLLLGLHFFLSLIIILSFIYPSSCIVKYVVTEKEHQLKEVMIILGIENWLHWTAWFMKSFILMLISLVIMVILVKVQWRSEFQVAVFTNTDWSLLLFFLLIYAAATICFCFMISSFFSKATLASSLTGVIWFLSYMPYSFTMNQYSSLTLGHKLLMSLLSNTAMSFGVKILIQYEASGEGLQWNRLFTPINEDENIHLGHIIIMMIVSCFIYLFISLYMEQVLPGQYGIPKPWYFPFQKSYWCPDESLFDEDIHSLEKRSEDDGFEADPVGKRVGIQIQGLRKVFDKKVAVHGLSMNLYEDDITVLLGHNGAGKTTTVSMLTGMFPPTSGTAIIQGSDIRKNLQGARMSLGLCPQHNILFDDLTVEEHVIFYSRLKGIASKDLGTQIHKYVNLLQLSDKINTQAKKLSGGMKRKLSVGLALCGDTRVVLFDEPTAGMDPSARRALWDLLQQEKNGRTILLLTHFMDEADVLGDRIAIMSSGKLMCHGTSFFLKKKYGVGYHLIFEKADGCDSDAVTKLLEKYIPNIEVDTEVGRELSYKMPEKYSNVFEEMLAEIEMNAEELKIMGYGISVTNLEEVFMAVGRETEKDTDSTLSVNDSESLEASIDGESDSAILLKGHRMIINQWRAMILKKYYQIIRNPLLFLVQLAMPIIFVAITVSLARNAKKMSALHPLKITLDSYQDPVTVLQVTPGIPSSDLSMKIFNEYKSMFDEMSPKHILETTDTNFNDYILDLARKNLVHVNSKYMVGAGISRSGKITAWFNNEAYHTAPLALNLVHNAITRAMLGSDYGIEVTNNPLPFTTETEIKQLDKSNNLGVQLGLNISFCMAFVTAFYVRFIIKERESKAKLLQFVSGSRIWIFWLSSFIMDFINFLIVMLGIIITLVAYQEEGWSSAEELLRIYFVFIIFGIAVLPFTYLLSFFFKNPVSGYSALNLINIFTGMALFLTVFIMSAMNADLKAKADGMTWFFMVFPHFSLAHSLGRMSQIDTTRKICNKLCVQLGSCDRDFVCQIKKECCSGYFQWEEPGILPDLIYMFITGVAYLLLILIFDYRWIDNILIRIREKFLPPPQIHEGEPLDDDVVEEKNRISSMSQPEIEAHNLILDQVSKYYGNYLAVNQISVGVRHSECFGLLGTNGAGKTSTFKILTGDERMSRGNAYVRGLSLRTDMKSVYQEIGYCPQFDALLEDLTGRETITFFALLRGVPVEKIDRIIKDLAHNLAFSDHLDKNVRNLSGGNKRKLSTAISVLGNPSVIYLDEPTSGMDPGARRQLWNLVSKLRERGKSIILTSHSMEECEALCTRLAIMVNGEFKCMGSTQRLKNKFSKGFVIKIKLKRKRNEPTFFDKETVPNGRLSVQSSNGRLPEQSPNGRLSVQSSQSIISSQSREDRVFIMSRLSSRISRQRVMRADSEQQTTILQNDVERVKHFIESQFPQAVLKEEYQGMLTFYIPTATIQWSAIFGLFEKNQASLNIEDYSISQTTLEEIFLDFAAHQREDQLEARKRLKKERKGCCRRLCC